MMKLIVLGPGCPRCEKLAADTREAADQLGIEYELEKITDIKRFIEFGVMMTPGLVVDGEVKIQGKVPPIDDIKKMLVSGSTRPCARPYT
jgi:small redox-active disulfide protein 2